MHIDWNSLTPWTSLARGALIGLAAAMFVLLNGWIASISGVVGGLLRPASGDIAWRVAFVAGLVGAPAFYALFLFKSAKAFETWLRNHRATSGGLWLTLAKRDAPEATVTHAEAVKIALCWGWIDGHKKGLDDQHFLQRFTPRRARSVWSKINVEKVAALIDAGRMREAGFAQIEAAKADGRWAQAYDGAPTSAVPDDLLMALETEPKAKAFFATVNAINRCAVLWRIPTAVKPETRATRIAQLVAMLARDEVIHTSQPKAKA